MGTNILLGDDEVLYGTEEIDVLAALRRVSNRRLFGGAELPRCYQSMPADELADGRWREMAPAGVGSNGTCGGDVQVTDSYSRRFAMVRPDGTWAVITYDWYGIAEGVEITAETEAQVVEQQIEFLIVGDPHELDYSIWEDDSYDKEYDPEPTEDGVRKHAEEFTVDLIEWDGEQFR